jgi:hypothetical protein
MAVRHVFKWFGIEANSRAVMTLLAVGGLLGGALLFATDKVLPVLSPALSSSDYGEGFRRGQREADLEQRIRSLEAQIEMMKVLNEERNFEDTRKRLKDGTF